MDKENGYVLSAQYTHTHTHTVMYLTFVALDPVRLPRIK